MNNERLTGKIIRIDPRGFGFITSPAKPFTRIFFHWSKLLQSTLHFTQLTKGMEVEFDIMQFPDTGYQAFRIEVLLPSTIPEATTERIK